MKYIAILLVLSATALASSLITQRIDNQSSIDLKLLESRVYSQYGEGDAGCEEFNYLKTGIHSDFMGKSYAFNYDYHVNLSDSGTIIYDIYGKFVDYVPFDSNSLWDNALAKDNL